jgi:RNA polymerase primary sigma factor
VGQLRSFVKQYENVPTPPVSLDALLGDSSASLHDLLEDVDADVAAEAAQLSEIWTAIERLPERSRYIMRLRFVEGRTLEETGNALNLTRARIKQIQDDSLRKLREMLKEGLHRRE